MKVKHQREENKGIMINDPTIELPTYWKKQFEDVVFQTEMVFLAGYSLYRFAAVSFEIVELPFHHQ